MKVCQIKRGLSQIGRSKVKRLKLLLWWNRWFANDTHNLHHGSSSPQHYDREVEMALITIMAEQLVIAVMTHIMVLMLVHHHSAMHVQILSSRSFLHYITSHSTLQCEFFLYLENRVTCHSALDWYVLFSHVKIMHQTFYKIKTLSCSYIRSWG